MRNETYVQTRTLLVWNAHLVRKKKKIINRYSHLIVHTSVIH